ncbi:hypothetical protein ABZ721_22440 [Streptomyces sp. NPDC006733]|uniref:hypothetical protein n=1 Tax=Streptomyces sp. NPDC006733 TaxID=3155460 RepID=UPI0033F748D9
MTAGRRAAALAAAALLCAALATGCGPGHGTADSPAPTPSGSQLSHLDQLVGAAESAADAAESDAASDK